MHRGWLISLALLTACLTPGSVSCPDGTVCPQGHQCATVAARNYCVERSQLGCTDGEACQGGAGTCHEGVCFTNECGNQLLDLGEACDDGNVVDSDDCSATCLSKNVCGNGIVDAIKGETCDSGLAGLSADGCASSCTVESLGWRDVTPRGLGARLAPALAYDSDRDRLWLFGGETSQQLASDTWEFVAQTWIPRVVAGAPPGRVYASMTYDAARRQVVLFGGLGAALLGDTWVFDGVQWSQRQVTPSPTPRRSAAMAYDRVRGEVVLWGGQGDYGSGIDYRQTWIWNGTAWTEYISATHPSYPGGSMAYDEERQEIVYVAAGETWTWNGAWTKKTVTGLNPSGFDVFAYSSTDKKLVGFFNGVTYTWDGSGWAQPTTSTAPDAVLGAAMAYGGSHGTIYVGGSSFPGGEEVLHDKIWTWTGSDWALVPGNTPSPAPRHSHAMAYNARSGEIIMFGGETVSCSALGDTWRWGDGAWQNAASANVAIARGMHAMTYDSKRDRIVVFGGTDGANCYNGTPTKGDTIEWDGVAWQQVATTGPAARRYAAMAYDSKAERSVLFGGADGGPGTARSDTWTWNGSTWAVESPNTAPPAREGAAMAYDPVRDRIVMFGGAASMTTLEAFDDTWEWDGTNWTQMSPPVKPAPRQAATMSYDPGRRVIVLAGGRSPAGAATDEVWEWNGTTWTQQIPRGSPGPSVTAVYSYIEQRLITFGDFNYETISDDTWALEYSTPLVGSERCIPGSPDGDDDGLTGCDDPDCWARCTPLCPPGTTCPSSAPQCGNGTCDPLETSAICDADC